MVTKLDDLIEAGEFPKNTGLTDLKNIDGVYGDVKTGVLLGCGATGLAITVMGTVNTIQGKCSWLQEGICSQLEANKTLGKVDSDKCPYSFMEAKDRSDNFIPLEQEST